jgi:hypothetical protein
MRIPLVAFGVAGMLASIAPAAMAQSAAAPNTVTISLAEYNRLVDRAANPAVPIPVPPTGAFVSQADLTLRADGDLLRGTITLQGEVLRDGQTAVPLLSGGTLIRARLLPELRTSAGSAPGLSRGLSPGLGARGSAPGSGTGVPILPQQGVFAAVLPAGPFTLQIEWAAAIVTEPGRASAQLPQLNAGTIRATIAAPGEGSDFTIDRALVTRRARAQGRLIVEATLAPGGGSRIGWSSRDAGTASPVRALRLLDDVKTLVTVAENDLRVTAIFDVTVVQGTTATLAVRLPDGFSLTSFTGAPNEGADVVDGRLVLNVPAGRARHQFLVALERPIVDAGSRRVVALPWLEGSQRETGDVAVEGVGALELAVAEQRPLTRIDVVELSAALTALAHEPLLAAYRYQRRAAEAVTLAFDVTRFPDAAVLAAAADRATATTLVTPEGRSLTEVTLTVRNQAQPFLRVGLPAGATLLSAEVAGAAVKPAQGADGLRIPLLRPGFRPQGPYAVSFVYLHAGPAFAEKGDATLTLARVDLPVAWLEWEMLLPDRLEASRFEGTAIPRELVPVASPMGIAYGVAEPITVISADKPRTADGRQAANELSLNVQNLQKRAAGVLPVRLDVPRAGHSHTFVRPLVMDEETRVSFRYKLKK